MRQSGTANSHVPMTGVCGIPLWYVRPVRGGLFRRVTHFEVVRPIENGALLEVARRFEFDPLMPGDYGIARRDAQREADRLNA